MVDEAWERMRPGLLEIVQRREFLCRHPPSVCPLCTSDQLQLLSRYTPAQWRCRVCDLQFTYEPPRSMKRAVCSRCGKPLEGMVPEEVTEIVCFACDQTS